MENILDVTIESYDSNGYGVAHVNKKVIFIPKALKDEKVKVKIINDHKKYAFAEIVSFINKSPLRIEEECPYAAYCGGCDFFHMPYDIEAQIKEDSVKMTLREIKDFEFLPIKNALEIYKYRNKVMIPFCKDDEDDIIYGFYEKNSHKVVSIDKCLISDDLSNEITHFIERYLSLFHISIYNEEKHEGLFKELMIRHTKTGEYMVVLVLTKEYDFSDLKDKLIEYYPEIKSIYININELKTNVVLSNNFKLIFGKKTILEDILGLKFEVHPSSFLQINHDQCERLYTEALNMIELNNNMKVIDAYCGIGTITLNIAKRVKEVIGIEVVEDAINNANKNKELNNINNAKFICGKCEDVIKDIASKDKFDALFVDPPRKGCDRVFIDTIIDMRIPNIVYISCNPATMARDIKILEENGYKLKKVRPFDLFPRTNNIETVCLMAKK